VTPGAEVATAPETQLAELSSVSWEQAVETFLAAAVDSAHTRRAYRRWLEQAGQAIRVVALGDLSGRQLAEYRASIISSALAPASQSQAIAALRSFLTWLRTTGAHSLPSDVVSAALKTPKAHVQRPYSVLAEPEVAAIIEAAQTARDRALLAVMLGAGLRVSEVVALDVSDVLSNQEGGAALYVRQGQGRRDRVVPVQPEVEQLLRAYLARTGRRLGEDGPLFRAHDRGAVRRQQQRGRLGAGAIWAVVQRCAEGAGIDAKKVSPHALRHTMALRTLRASGNVMAVKELLGHSALSTTQRYLAHLQLDELRRAIPPLPLGA
jgi:site-specific recombinase XerD